VDGSGPVVGTTPQAPGAASGQPAPK
jgi:hypothetical protein